VTYDDLAQYRAIERQPLKEGEVRYGYASAVLFDEQGAAQGGAEPRRSHVAAAPEAEIPTAERRE
ncbi:MAG: hypothetical protein HYX76_00170, partial [Acidobacteria bacterium]|nr:hypothetical protein [Acidobacteriota bacterium]